MQETVLFSVDELLKIVNLNYEVNVQQRKLGNHSVTPSSHNKCRNVSLLCCNLLFADKKKQQICENCFSTSMR